MLFKNFRNPVFVMAKCHEFRTNEKFFASRAEAEVGVLVVHGLSPKTASAHPSTRCGTVSVYNCARRCVPVHRCAPLREWHICIICMHRLVCHGYYSRWPPDSYTIHTIFQGQPLEFSRTRLVNTIHYYMVQRSPVGWCCIKNSPACLSIPL